MVLHRKLVEWLLQRDEPRAAAWFEEYWTRERGNYMLVHGEVGGTNSNCGTEGNWGGVKKAVCGTAGTTCRLAVRSVVPSLIRFLVDKKRSRPHIGRGAPRKGPLLYAPRSPSQAYLIRSR